MVDTMVSVVIAISAIVVDTAVQLSLDGSTGDTEVGGSANTSSVVQSLVVDCVLAPCVDIIETSLIGTESGEVSYFH